MENNNAEVAEMRSKFSKILKDILYICRSLTGRSQKVLSQLEDTKDDLDNSYLESVGLKIAIMLEVLKGNSTVSINYLLKEINSLNTDRTEKLFCDMNTKLLECKSSTVVKDSTKYVFAQLAEKETSTDYFNHKCNCSNDHVTIDANTSSTNNLFSLRRQATNDTIKTEDSWEDTLQRTKGKKDLKNKNLKFQGNKENEDDYNVVSTQENDDQDEEFQGNKKNEDDYNIVSTQKNDDQDEVTINEDDGQQHNFDDEFDQTATTKGNCSDTTVMNRVQDNQHEEDNVLSNKSVNNDGVFCKNDSREKNWEDGKNKKSNKEGKVPLKKGELEMLTSSSDDELSIPAQTTPKKRMLAISSSSETDETADDQSKNDDDDNAIEDIPKSVSDKITFTDSNEGASSIISDEKACASVNIKDPFTQETEELVVNEKNPNKATQSLSIENETLTVNQENIPKISNEKGDNDNKVNKEDDEYQEYKNPYSVETEKISSEEESEPCVQQKNLLSEHNYSSTSDLEDGLTKFASLKESTTDNESNTLKIADGSESYVTENDSNIPLHTESGVVSDFENNDNVHIINDHNYSSSSPNYIDTDETDIEKEFAKSDSDDNIGKLEIPEAEDKEHLSLNTCSNQSYEFDISNFPKIENAKLNDTYPDVHIYAKELEDVIGQDQNNQQSTSSKENDNTEDNEKIKEGTSSKENDNTEDNEKMKEDIEYQEREEDLMDITMEEILSDCENKGDHMKNSSEEKIPLFEVKIEKQEIKWEESDGNEVSEHTADEVIENPKNIVPTNKVRDELLALLESDGNKVSEHTADEVIEKPKNIVPTNKVRDELLALLEEVSHSQTNNDQFRCLTNTNDSDESINVDSILQELQEDDSELSDSIDSDCSLNLSDIVIHSDNHVDNLVIDVDSDNYEETLVSGDEISNEAKKGLMNKYNLVECYVPLEQLQISKNMVKQLSKMLDDDIDWLCDLKNLSVKVKPVSSASFDKSHHKRRRRRSRRSSVDTSETLSDFTSEENEGIRSSSPNLNHEQKERLDEILAAAICNDLKGGSDNSSDIDSSDSNCHSKEPGKNITDKKNKSNEKLLTKEELEKKAWRNDPLLKGKFSLSESNSDEEGKKKRKSKRYEHDTEFSIHSDEMESDSDNQELLAKNKSKLEDNEISPIKKNIPISDSSDSDSDVQYVSPIKPQRDPNDEEGSTMSQKGRRNIRSIVSDTCLAQETQEAKREESERIERLKDRHRVFESLSQSFSSQDNEEENPLILDINEKTGDPLIKVHPIITKKLKPHQRKGIQFMWNSCYETVERIKAHPGSGCILAHCMGLGKTLQVLTLVHTLFTHEETDTKHVLIVCPLSTVSNWKKELKFALEGLENDISLYTLPSKKDIGFKYETVKQWYFKRRKSILVLGYEGFESLTNECKLDKKADKNLKNRILEALVNPGPSLVVCDEGHLIKNKTAIRTMALNNIKTKRRIVLTGTPLQNNLIEYYHMVHFVKPNLLGTIKEFKTNFVNPITNGQYEDSTIGDIKLMRSRTHVLHKILAETVQRVEDTELEIYLPKMVDHAVFIQLHQVQVNLYNHYSNLVRHNVEKTVGNRFLADFHMFQYLCTHPHLLALMEKSRNKKVKEQDVICEEDEPVLNIGNWWKDIMPQDADCKIEYGHKLLVLKSIIEECEAIGDKMLVFSQKIAELDLIEHFLKTIGTKECQKWKKKTDYERIDGTVSPDYRTNICDNFNNEKNVRCRVLLMSTKVGGLGLNLTAANRVVIMTVHWNPSYDTQSVFRVYRFGQKKKVYIYRLISLDTMEEKVYQRSVTKLAIARRVVDKHQITRHYKSVDLQEIYSCQPTADNERPTPNVPEDEMLAKLILKLPFIFKYHEHKTLLADRPEDKLTEQEMAAAWEEFKNKDIPKTPLPPPPPQPYPPQLYNINSPTYEQVFNIGRTNFNQTSTSSQQFSLEKNDRQHYNPKLQSNAFVMGPPRKENRIPMNIFSNNLPRYCATTNGKNTSFSIPSPTYQQLRGIPALKNTHNIGSKKFTQLSNNLTSNSHQTVSTNSLKSQYRSPAPEVVSIPNHTSNKELGKLVQNPFSNEFTSTTANHITSLEQKTSSQATSKPVKRKLGSTEVIIKKMKTNFNSIISTHNESIQHKETGINNPNRTDLNGESFNDKDAQLRDGLYGGLSTMTESSNNNKENSDVITIL